MMARPTPAAAAAAGLARRQRGAAERQRHAERLQRRSAPGRRRGRRRSAPARRSPRSARRRHRADRQRAVERGEADQLGDAGAARPTATRAASAAASPQATAATLTSTSPVACETSRTHTTASSRRLDAGEEVGQAPGEAGTEGEGDRDHGRDPRRPPLNNGLTKRLAWHDLGHERSRAAVRLPPVATQARAARLQPGDGRRRFGLVFVVTGTAGDLHQLRLGHPDPRGDPRRGLLAAVPALRPLIGRCWSPRRSGGRWRRTASTPSSACSAAAT